MDWSWFLKPWLYILENHMLSVCICDNRPTPAYTIAKPWNLSNSIVVHPQLSHKRFSIGFQWMVPWWVLGA
jgi:hypothetical protein